MDQEAALIEHPGTDEDVEITCEIGIGPGWFKMSETAKDIYRGYFRKVLKSYGVRHREASKA